MSLGLRYVFKRVIKENFVSFIDTHAYTQNKNSIEVPEEDEDDDVSLAQITKMLNVVRGKKVNWF